MPIATISEYLISMPCQLPTPDLAFWYLYPVSSQAVKHKNE